jgi:hypothetical protein
MKGVSDTDVSGEEIILRVASEDPSAIGALRCVVLCCARAPARRQQAAARCFVEFDLFVKFCNLSIRSPFLLGISAFTTLSSHLNAVHQRESQVYLKQKILEKLRENRKKEIIVERYEAKLKEEQEQLAREVQRANEARQRSQGQREKQSSNERGSKVRSFAAIHPSPHSSITVVDFHCCSCHPLAVIGGQPAGEVLPRTTRRLLPAETRCPADSDVR